MTAPLRASALIAAAAVLAASPLDAQTGAQTGAQDGAATDLAAAPAPASAAEDTLTDVGPGPVPAASPEAAAPADGVAAGTDEAAASLAALQRWQADPALFLDAAEVNLDDFLWAARPVVVFADTPADPAYQRQIELLRERPGELIARDVVVLTDTDPAAQSDVRQRLRPRGFTLAIVGKDGGVKLRKPSPWDVREISRSIDKMPQRQQELREERGGL